MLSATGITAALAILAISVNVVNTEPSVTNQAGASHVVAADGSGDFSTIQAAVDAAEPGDTISIAPGTYEEAVRVTTDVTIVGGGADPSEVVVHIPDSSPSESLPGIAYRHRSAFWFEGVSSEISNLTITGPSSRVTALAVNGGELTVHGIVEDFDPYTGYPYGFLYVAGDASGEVFDNTSKAFVWLDGSSSMTIRDNTIHNVVSSDGESTPYIHDNDVGGVWARGTAQPTIEGNRIDFTNSGDADGGFSSCGVYVNEGAARPTIVGNDIRNARFGVCAIATSPTEIRDNSFDGNETAISLTGTDTVVTGNDIRGDGHGVLITGNDAPTISGNAIDVGKTAILVNAGSPLIDGNVVCGGEGNIEVAEIATPDIGENEVC